MFYKSNRDGYKQIAGYQDKDIGLRGEVTFIGIPDGAGSQLPFHAHPQSKPAISSRADPADHRG